jgi:hypothetical protein
MSKVRKALAGGFSAGVAAVATGFTFTGAPTTDQVGQLLGLFVGGFFVGFVTVYAAPANQVQR